VCAHDQRHQVRQRPGRGSEARGPLLHGEARVHDRDRSGDGARRPRWIELRIPGAETLITLFTPTGHEDRIGTFVPMSLWADDIEGTYATLLARGVEFEKAPEKQPWGMSMILVDSEGNKLHVGSR
jgi:uncharacterized glyoxalase superfamily protein PhnB